MINRKIHINEYLIKNQTIINIKIVKSLKNERALHESIKHVISSSHHLKNEHVTRNHRVKKTQKKQNKFKLIPCTYPAIKTRNDLNISPLQKKQRALEIFSVFQSSITRNSLYRLSGIFHSPKERSSRLRQRDEHIVNHVSGRKILYAT